MDEILINTTTTGLQHEPAVAPLAGSFFMTVWTDASDGTIKAQRLHPDGTRSGSEVAVSTVGPLGMKRHAPAITAAGGGLAVAWIAEFASAFVRVGLARSVSQYVRRHRSPGDAALAWAKL